MKIIIYLFLVTLFIYAGCKSDDNPTTPSNPTGEVEVTAVSFDSIYSAFGGGLVTQTKNFGTGALNFTDRDSTRISFSYKGLSNAADTLLYITDTTSTRLYTLRDASASDTYKSVNITVPSIKKNCNFYYTMRAKTNSGTGSPYLVIKDFKMFKK
ncbi:MAG: hypothetical protein JST55_10210 [Bacteroidetes bacterium]|nr:hypothetical protein [Bacteroidota bacterium]